MKEFKTNLRSMIDRDDFCVAEYLRDINRYSMVSPEEEAQLAHEVKKGGTVGERAKKRLVEANLRFVVSVANQFKQKHIELADLISEGNIGLLKAAQHFDETRGFKFISYAVWWIRQSIMAAIDNCGEVFRLPSNQQRLLQEYKRMDREMMQLEQRNLTLDEFCDVRGVDRNLMRSILDSRIAPVKMDAQMEDDSDSTYGDMIASESKTDASMDKESLHSELSEIIRHCLKEREADIVCRYFGFGCERCTFEAIAESYGLSRERTRQILLNAIVKLKQSPYSTGLVAYLAA